MHEYCEQRESNMFQEYFEYASVQTDFPKPSHWNEALNLSQDEKTNLNQICLVQICCKYELCTALHPVQVW